MYGICHRALYKLALSSKYAQISYYVALEFGFLSIVYCMQPQRMGHKHGRRYTQNEAFYPLLFISVTLLHISQRQFRPFCKGKSCECVSHWTVTSLAALHNSWPSVIRGIYDLKNMSKLLLTCNRPLHLLRLPSRTSCASKRPFHVAWLTVSSSVLSQSGGTGASCSLPVSHFTSAATCKLLPSCHQTFAVGVTKLLPCQLNFSIDLKTMSIT